jgi:hemerythrin
MAYKWDPSLAVGVSYIDEQHQELFQRIDALLVALHALKGKEEAIRLMAFLDEYVIEHFGGEADLMEKLAYPGAAAHLAQHRHFVNTCRALLEELKARGPGLALALRINTEVGNWLREHILKTDRALARYILKEGRSQVASS